MKRTLVLLLLIANFNFAKAQEQTQTLEKPQVSGYHQHAGFYLSMSIGPVFGKITDDIKGVGLLEFTGTGAQFDFKIGGAISENLILHATLVSSSIAGPTVKNANLSATTSNSVSLGEAMIGAGITYYMMPSNIFLSGSLGFGNFTVSDSKNDINTSTKRGVSLQIKAGKEWWISKNWGFGIGLTYGKTNLTNIADGLEEKMDSNRFGILFNTTFN